MKLTWEVKYIKLRGKTVPKWYIKEYYARTR